MEANSNVINIRRPAIWLFAICLIHVILWILKRPGTPETDDFYYAEEAKNILSGDYHFGANPKNHRIGLFAPVALLIWLFGDSNFVISLFPLLISLTSVALLFSVLKKHISIPSAVLGAGLLSFNITQVDFSNRLFPDVVLAFWMFLFALSLYKWLQEKRQVFLVINLFSFLAGIFTKELMVAILPFAAIAIALDSYRNRSLKSTFTYALAFSILVFIIGLGCHLINGDALLLNRGVEEFHNEAFGKHFTRAEIAHRLFVEPFQLLNRSLGLLLILIPTLVALLYNWLTKKMKDPFTNYITLFFLCLLAYLWAGSSSLTSYVPIWLIERMWIPLLIPACFLLSTYLAEGDRRLFLLIGITLFLLGSEQAFFFGWKRGLLFLLFSGSFLFCGWKNTEPEKRSLLLLLPYLILAFYFVFTNSGWNFFS